VAVRSATTKELTSHKEPHITTETIEQPTSRRQRNYTEVFALLALLAEQYPGAFRHEHESPVPLAIGISAEVLAALDGAAEPWLMGLALRVYTNRADYLRCLIEPGAMRHGLDGNVTKPVSEEHQADARERLTAAMEKYRSRLDVVSAGKAAGLAQNRKPANVQNRKPVKAGYPRKTGQLEDSHRDLKCRKARPRWLRIQKPEALMLQSVPPYVDTLKA